MKRRALVAPFVITVAMAPACGGPSAPVKEPLPSSDAAPATSPEPDASAPEGAAPAASDAEAPPPAPGGQGSWQNRGTAESPRWAFVYDEPAAKPPGDKRHITPGPAHTPSMVWIAADGKCSFEGGMTCPEGASCNPPPPYEVQCPPGLEAAKQKK